MIPILSRPDSRGISRENVTAVVTAVIAVYNLIIAPRAGWPALSVTETAALLALCGAAWAIFNRSRGV